MGFIGWLKGEEPNAFEKWLHSDEPGHFGEYLINYALGSLKGYHQSLCNIYLPYKDRTSEVDVVLLHETGIYAFESKNYSGWIYGTETDQYWMQVLSNGEKHRFYNPVLQNHTHIKALRQLLGLRSNYPIRSYIVFSERCELKKMIRKKNSTVVILKRLDMIKTLKHEIASRSNKFTGVQINKMYEILLPYTNVTEEEKQEHIAKAQAQQGVTVNVASKKSDVQMYCPKCGKPMVLRTATKGSRKGSKFWGCSTYPKCKAIVNID